MIKQVFGLVLFVCFVACDPDETIPKTPKVESLLTEQNSIPENFSQSEIDLNKTRDFTLLTYNVENLFDLDGISNYNDYSPRSYGKPQLDSKLSAISKTLSSISPEGPDIVLLQEIELDQSPASYSSATDVLLDHLNSSGLEYDYVSKGRRGNSSSVICITLSKFPIKAKFLHPIERARPILETHISIDGRKLVVFNNHWKSGASSNEMEIVRLQNAKVLRSRIDELQAIDPQIDIVVGGDLNSHYNQAQVYKESMQKTGVNDILLSHGFESNMTKPTPLLYNLWHELPFEQRGSDVWKGEWGTLMHILLSNGLYDDQGVQYISDSFQVINLPDFNIYPDSLTPRKWSNDFNGYGVSDHLPIMAKFTTSRNRPELGKCYHDTPARLPAIDYKTAIKKASKFDCNSSDIKNIGRIFYADGKLTNPTVSLFESDNIEVRLWRNHDPKVEAKILEMDKNASFRIYGQLSSYRSNFQLTIVRQDWINKLTNSTEIVPQPTDSNASGFHHPNANSTQEKPNSEISGNEGNSSKNFGDPHSETDKIAPNIGRD